MWQSSCSLSTLKARAQMNQKIRDFFSQRQVLEVETPILSSSTNSDPKLESFISKFNGPGLHHQAKMYLHTSPEFFMKRLLASGSGDIYQIAKVFRDGEAGCRHNPEFTMLEWYRVDIDHFTLMQEVTDLIHEITSENLPVLKMTYRELFLKYLDIDIKTVSINVLANKALECNISLNQALETKDDYLDLLLSFVIEPQLPKDSLFYLYHYPASQAALAKIIEEDGMDVGCRFELYWQGLELANGFYELSDAQEQRTRFEYDLMRRAENKQDIMPLDENFLAALPQLPNCSGVAFGLDRLLMCILQIKKIEGVLSFGFERC